MDQVRKSWRWCAPFSCAYQTQLFTNPISNLRSIGEHWSLSHSSIGHYSRAVGVQYFNVRAARVALTTYPIARNLKYLDILASIIRF